MNFSKMSTKNSEHNDVAADSLTLAKNIATLIAQKKGENIQLFDLRGLSPITDYFVIATGLSDIHIKTLANHIIDSESPRHVEGLGAASWVLIDFFDVIVHIFSADARAFYGLERLWGDAPKIEIPDD
jgi:ribosome-associated protein